jgi:uncharacterized RmlC-like cupin family protein
MAEITVLPGASPDEAVPTPGMIRRDGLIAEHLRVIHVTTGPGLASGWHHHADHETVGYVLAGRLRLEWGPGGGPRADAGPGDYGSGVSVVNVDGPEEA